MADNDLHLAVLENDGQRTKQLADDDPSAVNRLAAADGQAGMAPIHLAARHGSIEMCALLYGLGAGLDVRDEEHQCTALGWAAYFGQTETAELLIRFGSDVEDRCNPLTLAQKQDHHETAKLLLQYGAPEFDE